MLSFNALQKEIDEIRQSKLNSSQTSVDSETDTSVTTLVEPLVINKEVKDKINFMLKDDYHWDVERDQKAKEIARKRSKGSAWWRVLVVPGFLSLHIGGIWFIRFISYKLISNRDIMAIRRN